MTLDEIAERLVLREMLEPLQIPAARAQAWVTIIRAALDDAVAERDREWVQACLFSKPPDGSLTPAGAVALVLAEERKTLRKIIGSPYRSRDVQRILAVLDARERQNE